MGMKGREEITLDVNTRGRIVYAKSNKSIYDDYLVLINKVEPDKYDLKTPYLMIYYHVSLIVPGRSISVLENGENGRWSWDNGEFTFYTPTKEEVEQIKNILKERGLKFVKGINKVIKR
jgi:hypothetical protein